MATITKTKNINPTATTENATEPESLKNSVNSLTENVAATSKEAINDLQNISSELASDAVAADAVSTNLVEELNNIDFQKMIGGPLQACVNAQVASSLATVNFINNVGFTTTTDGKKELVMVDFTHDRKVIDEKGDEKPTTVKIKVPLLAMLPIPSLRIEHAIIDFNVKLNSVQTSNVSDSLGIKVEAGGGFGPVNFKVSASYQRNSTTGVEVKKEYALNVNVKCVQDEIPAGLEKILNMLSA